MYTLALCRLISSRSSYFSEKVSQFAILYVLEQLLLLIVLPITLWVKRTLKNPTKAAENWTVVLDSRLSCINSGKYSIT